MNAGTVKEIKTHEYRVGLVPASVREIVITAMTSCWKLIVVPASDLRTTPTSARAPRYYPRVGCLRQRRHDHHDYEATTCRVQDATRGTGAVYLSSSCCQQITDTYSHSAGSNLHRYETVTDGKGHLPLLKPMSEFAGRATPRLARAARKKAS